jgi:hypothetical protein
MENDRFPSQGFNLSRREDEGRCGRGKKEELIVGEGRI